MIEIRQVRSEHKPVVVCDICKQPIFDIGLGVVVRTNEPVAFRINSDILYAHKGACHDAAERQKGGKELTAFDELQKHLLDLGALAGRPGAK
jgi:hypothetical protein